MNLCVELSAFQMIKIGLRWLVVSTILLATNQSLLVVANATLPLAVVRAIYPNEWGISRPSGIAYSTKFGHLFLLDKIRTNPNTATIVTITPHEEFISRVQVDFAVGDPLNMTFDEQRLRLLLLDRQLKKLAQINLDEQGHLNPATLRVVDLSYLYLTNIQGIATDSSGQQLFLLDKAARRIIRVPLTIDLNFPTELITSIDLSGLGAAALHGLTVQPTTGHLFINTPTQQILYEITQDGSIVNTYPTGAVGLNAPQSFVFAPSADLTDDPAILHLFIADSYLPDALAADTDTENQLEIPSLTNRLYLPVITVQSENENSSVVNEKILAARQSGKGRLGEIVEIAFDWVPELVEAAANPPTILNLVQSINTSNFSPPSPDPSGITFLPSLNRLLIADGEVDEIAALFTGANLFDTTRTGNLVRIGSTLVYSKEPTGVAFNTATGHLFIADDDKQEIFEVDPAADGLYGTNDDRVTSFDTAIFSSFDPEGVTYDGDTGALFIIDGINTEVYRVSPGANGRFDGMIAAGGDDLVSNFDVQILNIFDPEGVYYDVSSKHLFLVGNNRTRLYEITTTGALVQLYDTTVANIIKNADITMAPGSNNPNIMNFYLVDRGIDNDVEPTENDGRLYELSQSPINPTPTLTPLPTVTPLPTTKSVCLAATQDTYLVQDAATKNTGSESDLKVKPDTGKERRILIVFDLTALPPSSTVLNATLRLYEDTKKDGQIVYVHRLISAWNELQATWTNSTSGTRWATAGGDFESVPIATFLPNLDNRYRDIPVTSITQNWLSSTVANFGVLLRSTGVNGEVKFKSRNEANTAKRPQLCITYQ